MQPQRRDDRLAARLNPADKVLLKRAAAIRGSTLSEFVVASAREAAERTIREHETITLTLEQTERVLDALANPPQPAARLIRAAERYRDAVRPE